MPLVSQDAVLLENFTGTGLTGAGHNGWCRIDGSTHTVVVTTDGGTPSVTVQWSLDGITAAASNVLSSISSADTATQAPRAWRYARCNVTANAGNNTISARVVSI